MTHSRERWERGPTGPVKIKGKSYPKLVEFSRPCMTCGKPFSIFVTEKIADGHADSNSFGLKNCEDHRRNKSTVDTVETEMLRTANATMSAELTAAYTQIRELQARLNKYELRAALSEMFKEQSLGTFPGVEVPNPFLTKSDDAK